MVTAESLLQSRFVIDMVSLDSISFTWLASEARMTLKIVAQTNLTVRQKLSWWATGMNLKLTIYRDNQKKINEENLEMTIKYFQHLRASLCKILISSFAHKMDFAHNFSVDFF